MLTDIIHALVAPVVMISANGLICLALYNRLAAIVNRLRLFSREHFDTSTRLAAMTEDEKDGLVVRQLQARLATLDRQFSTIMRRARLLRNALVLLLSAVLVLLCCSLALGLALVLHGAEALALALFVVGVAFMIAGTALAIKELVIALEPIKAEKGTLHEAVLILPAECAGRHRKAQPISEGDRSRIGQITWFQRA
jgi:hypothetical protein